MKDPQQEVEELRAGVSCVTVLERASPPWLIDEKESSRRRLKYRRGAATVSARAPTRVIAAGSLAAGGRPTPRYGPNFLFAPSPLSLRSRSEGEGDGYRWRRPRRQGCVAGSRAFRAPLQRDRLAVVGQGRGEDNPKAIEPSSCAQTRGADMTGHDPEIEELRDKVHCAVVLERTPPPWKLDRKESTRLSLKYRRGKGEILIVSHAGRGWWDPTSDAKGDVFRLVQRLEPA